MTKIYSLLKPGGYMSFAEPNLLNPQVFIMFKYRRFFPEISPDENAFWRWSLKKSLLATGFEQVKITPFDWLHPSTPTSLIPVVQKMGQWLEQTPILCECAGSLCIRGRRPG